MLNWSSGRDDRLSYQCFVFCDGSAFLWGLFFMPGALPLNTPRPFRLSDFCQQKSRHGRSSDDDLLMPEALPLKSGGGIPPERHFSWINGIKTKTYPPKPVFSWTKAFRPRDLSLTYIELKEKIEEYELFIYI